MQLRDHNSCVDVTLSICIKRILIYKQQDNIEKIAPSHCPQYLGHLKQLFDIKKIGSDGEQQLRYFCMSKVNWQSNI